MNRYDVARALSRTLNRRLGYAAVLLLGLTSVAQAQLDNLMPVPPTTTRVNTNPALPLPPNNNGGSLVNTTYIIDNKTGLKDENIWVTFQSAIPASAMGTLAFASTVYPQTVGPGLTVNANSSYSLAQLKANTGLSFYGTTQMPVLSLNTWNAGRMYINYGTSPLPEIPSTQNPATTPYGIWEFTEAGGVFPATYQTTTTPNANPVTPATNPQTYGLYYAPPPTQSNGDISYVDGMSIAMSTTVCGADGKAIQVLSVNPVTTKPELLGELVKTMPVNAQESGTYLEPITNTPKTGVIRVLSPASSGNFGQPGYYHDWTSLITTLTNNETVLNVGSFRTPENSALAPYALSNALFGYGGYPPGVTPTVPNGGNAQYYTYTAQFMADLNTSPTTYPGTVLSTLGIPANTPGVVITGTNSVDPFLNQATSPGMSIYITTAALNAATGIYGNNPPYTVVPTTQGAFTPYQTVGILNDLPGRIVGDLMACIVFGWSSSTTTISTHSPATQNISALGLTATQINGLPTGQYFALCSLAGAQKLLSDWIGSGINTDANAYDIYANAVAENSEAYGTGFGDRFQGSITPNTYWYAANPPPNSVGTQLQNAAFVKLTLEPLFTDATPAPTDSYTVYANDEYQLAGQAFNSGDQVNGYYYYAYYFYFKYLGDLERGVSGQTDLNSFYEFLADTYWVAYSKQGNTQAAYAWYNYIRTFIQ